MKRLSAFAASTILFTLLICDDALAQEVRVTRHVYGKEAPEAQILDAYLLVGEYPSPVLVQINSGGWKSKPPKRAVPGLFDAYHSIGFSVVVVCHRTIDDRVSWPAPADDVARAIQFIRLHAKDWNIDPERISITGRSSGHIAMMVGFGKDRNNPESEDPVIRKSSSVRCVIQQGGPTDLAEHMRKLFRDREFTARRGDYLRGRLQALLRIEAAQVETEEFYRRLHQISPITLVDKNTVPVLMLYTGPEGVTSRDDPRLKWDIHTPISGLVLAEKLKQLGVEHELVINPDLGRGSARSMKAQSDFLKKHNEILQRRNHQ